MESDDGCMCMRQNHLEIIHRNRISQRPRQTVLSTSMTYSSLAQPQGLRSINHEVCHSVML